MYQLTVLSYHVQCRCDIGPIMRIVCLLMGHLIVVPNNNQSINKSINQSYVMC